MALWQTRVVGCSRTLSYTLPKTVDFEYDRVAAVTISLQSTSNCRVSYLLNLLAALALHLWSLWLLHHMSSSRRITHPSFQFVSATYSLLLSINIITVSLSLTPLFLYPCHVVFFHCWFSTLVTRISLTLSLPALNLPVSKILEFPRHILSFSFSIDYMDYSPALYPLNNIDFYGCPICNRATHYIFALRFLSIYIFFFFVT